MDRKYCLMNSTLFTSVTFSGMQFKRKLKQSTECIMVVLCISMSVSVWDCTFYYRKVKQRRVQFSEQYSLLQIIHLLIFWHTILFSEEALITADAKSLSICDQKPVSCISLNLWSILNKKDINLIDCYAAIPRLNCLLNVLGYSWNGNSTELYIMQSLIAVNWGPWRSQSISKT